MIISHTKKFVFFSFPKTGSESIREMLHAHNEETIVPYKKRNRENPWYPHMAPAEADTEFRRRGLEMSDYFTFTLTRNPFQRSVSVYEMVMAVDGVEKLKRKLGLKRANFETWLTATLPHGRGAGGRTHQRWRKFGTWTTQAWANDAGGNRIVDRIIRLDDIHSQLPNLLTYLEIPIPETIVHKNKRVTQDWRGHHNSQTIRLISDRYREDIEEFEFSFD